MTSLRLTFITNFIPHYRVETFRLLAQRYQTRFVLFSDGREKNWLQENGTASGHFQYTYLKGFRFGGVRIAPGLIPIAWLDNSDVTVKCLNGKFALPVVALACMARRHPFIIWTGDWSVLDTRLSRLFAKLNNAVCRHADAVVTYGEHVSRYLIANGVPSENIITSQHAVTNAFYSRPVSLQEVEELRSSLQIPDDARIVLSVGRLVEIKGLQYLIRGFAEAATARNLILVLVGTGPEREQIEALAKELKIAERVRFAGYMSPYDTVRYYAAATVFVIASVTSHGWKESWGLVVNEAFNQGVPVIATNAVGAADGGLVRDGENGFIVPERDAHAIAAAVSRVVDDQALRGKLSANARSRIATWGQEQMVDAFSAAIERVTQKRRGV
ncbi:glycosyltransferase family 4 protein [Paludibaculum fermentans]|uniref:Glycosyltransferase family 4 protein n=1 Tax=Paludibaculum fermentans TaxID=1473598 RepID=A0A7S7SJA0_PALFE|nr:glycosyltransferase family 4 protein [Paludibaculum fermentans]QOY86256.1 glycosyltransferase family 4 protein [Paludibaculum fermentans]